jgi:opacity protein-like surface antigen
MLKKITLVAIAFIASSGIAFADTSDNMPSNNMDNSAANTADAGNATAGAAPTQTPATHHKHHKNWCKQHPKKCHKQQKHHYTSSTSNDSSMMAPASDQPVGGYKGEMAAAPCPACMHTNFNTGAYLGLSVGSRVNYLSRPIVSTAIDGTIFGGYSMLWDQFYGALEIFGQDDGVINNYRSTKFGSSSSSWGYGLSVLPGYLISDNVLGYLRLGVVNTRFNGHNNSNSTGGQVGLGMQTALTNCWDLRGEWIYSFYNSITAGVPRTQQFNLGLLYKFQL